MSNRKQNKTADLNLNMTITLNVNGLKQQYKLKDRLAKSINQSTDKKFTQM